jgi:carboxyl-terminal processing protease
MSAGHCSMKETILLSDGSAVTLTTALYNPPVSPNFEGVGVKPDYEVKLTTDPETSLFLLDEQSDSQLKKAIEAAGGTVSYVTDGSTDDTDGEDDDWEDETVSDDETDQDDD